MKIKQVEELVGITSKNIRFYEDQGLLNPDRADNGYREYHQKEVDTLKQIKLLRRFGVSVEEIKSVFQKKESLSECLEKHITSLLKEQENLEHMRNLAKSILDKNETIDSLNTEMWLELVDNLEKEGTSFVDLSKEDIHMRKKAGAYLSGIAAAVLMVLYAGLGVVAFLYDDMPVGVLAAFIFIPLVIIVCIVYVVKSRIKEIEGGEEDEASKY